MNPELQKLLKAYDAFRESFDDAEAARQETSYESLLDEILLSHPRMAKDTLQRFVETRYRKWLLAQKTPPTLPPKA